MRSSIRLLQRLLMWCFGVGGVIAPVILILPFVTVSPLIHNVLVVFSVGGVIVYLLVVMSVHENMIMLEKFERRFADARNRNARFDQWFTEFIALAQEQEIEGDLFPQRKLARLNNLKDFFEKRLQLGDCTKKEQELLLAKQSGDKDHLASAWSLEEDLLNLKITQRQLLKDLDALQAQLLLAPQITRK